MYIVASVFVIARSSIEIGRVIYDIVDNFPAGSFWNSELYFLVYSALLLIPLVLFLVGIQGERNQTEEKG